MLCYLQWLIQIIYYLSIKNETPRLVLDEETVILSVSVLEESDSLSKVDMNEILSEASYSSWLNIVWWPVEITRIRTVRIDSCDWHNWRVISYFRDRRIIESSSNQIGRKTMFVGWSIRDPGYRFLVYINRRPWFSS